ncbi:MAG: hypothetical protein NTU54_04555 [Candidatus Omnitrophica bacterium]|nr:hypothetical protein [Candidatus Omnitrophota bacterium]
MKNWEKKDFVVGLRRRGLSYREIKGEVPFTLSKSTISSWCKDIELTARQKNRLELIFKDGSYRGRLAGSKTTQIRRAKEVAGIREQAKSEISSLTENEFKLAGLMLYWAEGAKSRYVDITNSDPALIKFMTDWLRLICGVPEERFRACLHLHSGQNEKQIKAYWSKLTNIPIEQFSKSYIKQEGSGYRKNILYKGTIKIRVCDSNLLHKILGWIEGIKYNQLVSI